MPAVRIALMNIRLVMRTRVALFFTFFFPLVFLFVYAGLFAHGNPQAVLYMFGPVVTLNIIGSGFWGLGIQSVVQRERGSLRRYRLAPIGPGTILAGNLLANYLLSLPTMALLVAVACLAFNMPLKISLPAFLILMTAGTFAFSSFGLTIASVANTLQEAQVYNNLAWLGLLFLSGTTIPLPLLPGWIQRLAAFLPSTYLVSAFQAVMVQGESLSRHGLELLALAGSGSVGILLAWKLFRWEKEERIPPRRKAWALALVLPFLGIGTWLNAFANPAAHWASVYSMTQPPGEVEDQDRGTALENFEARQAGEALVREWQVTIHSDAATKAVAEVTLASPGANQSQQAVRFQGKVVRDTASPAQVCARGPVAVPAGTKLSGVVFWLRGDAPFVRLRLAADRAPLPHPPELGLAPRREWQRLQIPAFGLTPPESDSPGPSKLILELCVEGAAGDFFVDLDEVRSAP